MNLKDYLIHQIEHKETDIVPYTFEYTEEVEQKLNKYYNGESWKIR